MCLFKKYRMRKYVIERLDVLRAGNLVTSWSCYNDNIKECYEALKANPNITLEEYKVKVGWYTKDLTKYNIYTFNINDEDTESQ